MRGLSVFPKSLSAFTSNSSVLLLSEQFPKHMIGLRSKAMLTLKGSTAGAFTVLPYSTQIATVTIELAMFGTDMGIGQIGRRVRPQSSEFPLVKGSYDGNYSLAFMA
jgi:hypothetical protein